jgi:DnaK suppressor protein
MNKEKKSTSIKFPASVLRPVNNFLVEELKKLKIIKKETKTSDPFSDTFRVSDNAAIDTDAAEQFGHARNEAVLRHIETKIIQIRKALSRVKIGKYGICEKCGKFIDTKRLMMSPETTICVNCKKKSER